MGESDLKPLIDENTSLGVLNFHLGRGNRRLISVKEMFMLPQTSPQVEAPQITSTPQLDHLHSVATRLEQPNSISLAGFGVWGSLCILGGYLVVRCLKRKPTNVIPIWDSET